MSLSFLQGVATVSFPGHTNQFSRIAERSAENSFGLKLCVCYDLSKMWFDLQQTGENVKSSDKFGK